MAVEATVKLLYSDKRESKSLWNFSLSPGWTQAEVKVFRLCLMKFGFGRWNDIVRSNYLIGKTVSQLCNQLQRMIGQQSIGEFYGLHLDPQRIFDENKDREGQRKNGCLINTGHNPNKEEVKKKREENRKKFGISEAEKKRIIIPVLKEEEMSSKILKSTDAKIKRLDLLEKEKLRLLKLMNGDVSEDEAESTSTDIIEKPIKRRKSQPRSAKKKNPKRRKRKSSEDVYADDSEDDME